MKRNKCEDDATPSKKCEKTTEEVEAFLQEFRNKHNIKTMKFTPENPAEASKATEQTPLTPPADKLTTENNDIKAEKTSRATATPTPAPSAVPTTARQQRNIDLKNKGLMKISLHGIEVYTDQQLRILLNTLKATEAGRAGPNLVTATIRIGTYTHANYGDGAVNINHVDFGPTFDQATQANANEIDDEIFAHNIHSWRPLTVESPLVEKQEFIKSIIRPPEVVFNQRAFINYTVYPIPEDVAVILSMGPKFAVPVYYNREDFDSLKAAAYMLNAAYGNPMMEHQIRENIREHVDKHQRQQHTVLRSDIRDFFHEALKTTKNFMHEHPDIITTQADKAKATILLNKTAYIEKGENLLKDETTYKLLQPRSSSTPAYMRMNERILSRMVQMEIISKAVMIEAIRMENKPANIYFLIKNHKQGAPVRPIVNTRNSMFYTASKAIAKLLNQAKDNGGKYNVMNSRQACERLKLLKICPDEKFYSLDIVQMFTNIPVDRAIGAVKKRQKILKLSDEMMQLVVDVIVHVCKISTEFAFNDKIYKQIRGLRMGSSLSPILADFVVEDMLDTAFMKIQRPVLLMKYVDDILTVLQTENAQEFLRELNAIDPNIKFEMEMEQNTSINYLDFTVINDGWSVRTKWYQKHIASGQFLNYHSHHSKSNIYNTALQYVITMISNTHPDFRNDIYGIALDRLTRNSYPAEYAKHIINTAKQRTTSNISKTPKSSNNMRYTQSLQYIPGLTEKLQQEIQRSASTLNDTVNIRIPAKPFYKMNQLVFCKQKNSNSNAFLEELSMEDTLDLTQEQPEQNNVEKDDGENFNATQELTQQTPQTLWTP